MIIGDEKYFKKEHYENVKGFAPAYLCELVVHCLELVSQLAFNGLEFRFKGGNSLLILLEDPRRFSIDIDIVTTVPKDYLTRLVKAITESCELLIRYEVRPHKTKPWLPMISYKLFYNSLFREPGEAYIMLDAVLEPSPCEGVLRQVKCLDIYRSEQKVEVPSISGLLADKLLTIGPSTLGIPLGKNKEAQRLKHVFDVSLLFRENYTIKDVKEDLLNCIAQENYLQRITYTRDEVFEDTLNFCSQPLSYESCPEIEGIESGSYLYEIVKGFSDFRKHIFKFDYTWELFKEDCRNVMGLIEKLKS